MLLSGQFSVENYSKSRRELEKIDEINFYRKCDPPCGSDKLYNPYENMNKTYYFLTVTFRPIWTVRGKLEKIEEFADIFKNDLFKCFPFDIEVEMAIEYHKKPKPNDEEDDYLRPHIHCVITSFPVRSLSFTAGEFDYYHKGEFNSDLPDIMILRLISYLKEYYGITELKVLQTEQDLINIKTYIRKDVIKNYQINSSYEFFRFFERKNIPLLSEMGLTKKAQKEFVKNKKKKMEEVGLEIKSNKPNFLGLF